jgi:capsular polysaccharide transport system permease protein
MSIAPANPSQASALVSSGAREVVLRRAANLSSELQRAARDARVSRASAVARPSRAVIGARRAATLWSGPHRWLVRSFAAIAVIPSLLCTLYFALIASDQYVSEVRLAVRAGSTSSIDTITSVVGLSSVQQVQDSFIVVDYLKSRAIVEQLEKLIGLSKMYSRTDIDYVSRFDPSDPIEDLVWYWWWKVKTAIEMPSGIIAVEVSAFSPEDSLKIAETVVTLSERLINEMSARAERDLLANAKAEVARAEERLRRVRAAIRDLRNEEGVLDPRLQGEGINRMIEQIRLDRIKMEQELSTIAPTLSGTSPQVQILRSRIEAANEQIALLERQLTQPTANGARTISRAILRFDELELERQVAEKQYTSAVTSLEAARVRAEQQRMYLSTFVRPVLATEATYPRRFWYSLAAVLVFLLAWVLFVTLWTKVHERFSH